MRSLLCFVVAAALVAAPQDTVVVEKNLAATMRDGVVLRADVYRPPGNGPWPALLQRTPYSKNDTSGPSRFRALASRGYVVIVQDTRGRYMSEGVARPHDEADDGFDTIAWAAALPYVNGKVGMFGGSYLATTQLLAATTRPPALVALFPSSSYASRYDMVFQGGAFYLSDGLTWNLDQGEDVRRRRLTPGVERDGPIGLSAEDRRLLREQWLWQLPLTSITARELPTYAPGYFQMLKHPSYEDYWDTFNIEAKHSRFQVPAFHLTGWYDTLLTGTLKNFAGLRANAGNETARRGQRLIVGPWTHSRPTTTSTRIGDLDFGPDAGFDSPALMERWFDRWLKDAPEASVPESPVRLFVMGENRWRDEHEWPLARARETSFYLHSGGRAQTLDGDGALSTAVPGQEPPDRYVYDPADPVPTGLAGGYSRSPADQRVVERRRDVLVYTGEPLTADLEVTGPIALELWIASSARDTDFTAKLVDVFPDGTARALTDGILRARYRAGGYTPPRAQRGSSPRAPRLLEPHVPTLLHVDVGATSNLFRAGHRIRLEVSSSNFPRFDRNPNTGGIFGEDAETRRADQTVFHDREHQSRLMLPVIPRPPDTPQRAAEARFMAGVSVEEISAIHRLATRRPHVAGSAASLALADSLRDALTKAGLQTETHDYRVHLSTPRRISVEIAAPVRQTIGVNEPASKLDPDSAHAELGPGYVAYSASGKVAAPAVYVNYGLPPDYEQLSRAGIDVRGRIVIARYGRSHRAVKIHSAETRGAAGIVIYSDPADDGYARGLPWPEGAWRADSQLQRGNGKYSWFWHGDPLTPGAAATAGAPALDPARAPTLPKIPAVVISSKEAAKILSQLTGPPVPAGFQGALPFTYRLGPGPAAVALDVQMDAGPRTIRNVLARIPGRDRSRQVILGTHHDAWTFGGMDPGSGLSAVFEVARGLAALSRQGWVPERDLVFAFWDAEEFGLVGSTEYAEAFERELRERTVTYINTDLFMRGRFDGGGTPSLRDFLVQVTKDVPAFDASQPVAESRKPAAGSRELAAGSGQPEAVSRQLVAGGRQPEAGSRQPVGGGRQPGAGSRQPEAGSREPGAGGRQPEAGSRQPEAGSGQPEAGSRQPVTGGRRPVPGSRQPVAGSREPGAGGRQPVAGRRSVYDGWRADQWRRQTADRRRLGSASFEVDLAALGSGADFVAFQDYLGLPTLQMEFDFEGSYGPYHSNYDTRWFVERHADPGFAVARTLTQVLGLAVMRLGSATVLPLRYSHYGVLIGQFLQTAEGWGRDEEGRTNLVIDLEGAKRVAVDILRRATELESRIDRRTSAGTWTAGDASGLNDRLVRLEQALLDEREPPDRRWYRHVIYGWNIYALYEGQPLPGLAEAVRAGNPGRVAEEIARITAALERMRAGLDEALKRF